MSTVHSQNLDAHYTTNAKVERPERPIAKAPDNMPQQHLFNSKDADIRLAQINEDIYQGYKNEKNKDKKNFAKIFGISTAAILTLIGVGNLIPWKK